MITASAASARQSSIQRASALILAVRQARVRGLVKRMIEITVLQAMCRRPALTGAKGTTVVSCRLASAVSLAGSGSDVSGVRRPAASSPGVAAAAEDAHESRWSGPVQEARR